MKKFTVLFCLVFYFLLCSCVSVFAGKYEGEGYNSSKEAALAFADHFSKGDLDGVISTFAIETFVDHFDTEKHWEILGYRGSTIATGNFMFPQESGYLHDLNILKRHSDIVDMLVYQGQLIGNGQNKFNGTLKNEEEVNAYLSSYRDKNWPGNGVNTETEALTAEEILTMFVSKDAYQNFQEDKVKINYESRALSRYRCDDIDYMAVVFSIDNEFFIQFLTGAKYGDKWYVMDAGAMVFENYLGLGSNYVYGLYSLTDVIRYKDWTVDALLNMIGQ